MTAVALPLPRSIQVEAPPRVSEAEHVVPHTIVAEECGCATLLGRLLMWATRNNR